MRFSGEMIWWLTECLTGGCALRLFRVLQNRSTIELLRKPYFVNEIFGTFICSNEIFETFPLNKY